VVESVALVFFLFVGSRRKMAGGSQAMVALLILGILSLFSLVATIISMKEKPQEIAFTEKSSYNNNNNNKQNNNNPPNWMPEIPLIKYLHKVQHPANCSSRKFLVYPMPKLKSKDTRNLGAMLTSLWRWVILALEDDRTVVIDSTNWNMADCPHNDGSEGGLNCYFEPFSSCDMSHVLAVPSFSSSFFLNNFSF